LIWLVWRGLQPMQTFKSWRKKPAPQNQFDSGLKSSWNHRAPNGISGMEQAYWRWHF